ncbi:MAG: aminoacyl-tRNA hydrolase [Planctomycetes bacterium]|nr:aminoacyl-tRNA hydrolase [Planctomycetota bacterium]
MSEREAKQVIVVRRDLKMRRGKEIAQGSHASVGAVLLIQRDAEVHHDSSGRAGTYGKEVHEAAEEWLHGQFSKICVRVDSEQELMEIFAAAQKARLPVKLITDSGRTEFHGVPTRTCLAIGPAWGEDIDKITGHLQLY